MKYFMRFIDSSKLYSPTKHMEWYKIAMSTKIKPVFFICNVEQFMNNI